MVYESRGERIDLGGLVRLYGAALIEAGGEQAEMSLEWMEMSGDKVTLVSYVLVFDFTPPGSEERIKKVFSFKTKTELLDEMRKVVDFINANRSE